MTHLSATLCNALLLATLTTLLSGCGGSTTDAVEHDAAPPAPTPVDLELATAELENVALTSRATASVEPLRRVTPGTKILGRVERLAVRAGDRVRRGALLVALESRDLEAAVAQAEAAVAMAEAQLENAAAQERRMVDLHSRRSVTDKALEDATAAQRVAQAAVAQAEANLAAARVNRSYAEIRSPLDGWVIETRVEAGDMTRPGAPVAVLEDLSRIKVVAQVPEADVVDLDQGAPVRLEILGREVEAEVDRLVPSGDPASRTFAVEMVVENAEGRLKSGMFARAVFPRGERQALRVPASAVVARGQLEGIFVAGEDSILRLRWIKTGRAEDDRVEVLSGLEAGERYAVAPPSGLADGTPHAR